MERSEPKTHIVATSSDVRIPIAQAFFKTLKAASF
jgi:hypothetical protein